MGNYLATQIELGKLTYAVVISKFPKYKEDIDTNIASNGWMIDANGKCVIREVSANS